MDLLNSTLSAVGQAGDAIDKFTGGRAVRGVLGGKGREALSFIPFSDTLGLTHEADKTSGRDLTDHYGITSKGDNSFGSHAVGFLADNVLSPGNWLGAAGAIKAAPTIGKGITAGAKALTGLDLIDHVRSGAKGIGKFMKGDSGAMPLSAGSGHPKPMSLEDMWKQATPTSNNLLSETAKPFKPTLKHVGDFLDKHNYSYSDAATLAGQPEFLQAVKAHFGADADAYAKMQGWDKIPSSFQHDPALIHKFEGHVGAKPSELHADDLYDPNIHDAFNSVFGKHADEYKKLVGTGELHGEAAAAAKAGVPYDWKVNHASAFDDEAGLGPKLNGGDTFKPEPGSLLEEIMSGKHLVNPYKSSGIPILSEHAAAVRKVDSSIAGIGHKFGDGPDTRGLAEAFIQRPNLDAAADPMAVADKFHNAMESGKKGAKSYFSHLYYDINDHLRQTGADKLPGELARIRSTAGSGSPASSLAPKPLDDLQKSMLAKFYEYNPTVSPHHTNPTPAWKTIMDEKLSDHFGEAASTFQPHVYTDTGSIPQEQKVESAINNLMTLLDHSRMPANMDLYRGIDGPGVQKIEQILGVKLNSPEAIGREFTDPGFMSTAYEKGTADSFSGLSPGYNRPDSGAVFHFPDVPKGKPASFMNSTENEILFPPGRKVRIDDNSEYPHRIKATLYSALMAAMAGRMARDSQGA